MTWKNTIRKGMSSYDKLEWLHSQVQEIQTGNDADLDKMLEFIEDLREPYLRNTDGSQTSGFQNTNQ